MAKRTADQAGLKENGVRSPPSVPVHDGVSALAKSLFERIAGSGQQDPAYPVINGATDPPKPILTNFIKNLKSQSGRFMADVGLLSSLADTQLFDGGLIDDRKYQMEAIIQLAASLPSGSDAQNALSKDFIGLLWNNLEHPPLSILGDHYKYRMPDGSHNNIMYPQLGKAGSNYARTCAPKTLKPGVLPDPGVIFDSIFARGAEPEEHPNKISSMLFYLASIIIHDVFHTDDRDPTKVKTSSYLDLAPLYGSSEEEQKTVRTFKDGLLKKDVFAQNRVLGFPPGVSALLVCFNRYHNYIAIQLKEINENNRFPPSHNESQQLKLDHDLFNTARLITCGLYVNIILCDYVRTILNLHRTESTWTLDPRDTFSDYYDSKGTPMGIGNQVSCEFNLVYRWHAAISKRDEKWSNDLYKQILRTDDLDKIASVSEPELLHALRAWLTELGSDPSKWTLDNGRYKRTKSGAFRDEDLAEILTAATDDVACAFGPRQVPVVMKLIEVMGMNQARAWNVASLNEFRKFFKLAPHKKFTDITKNTDVAHALESLYGHPDYVELYPGLVAEDAKEAYDPGSGLCPGYTISRAILSDATTLVRGDRFYTIDYTPATLTNWGYNQIKPDPDVAAGGVIYNLIMRALPNWYRGNSIYAMYPFTVPQEMGNILEKLGRKQDYDFSKPSLVPIPTPIKSYKAVTGLLGNQVDFRVPWGAHTTYITGHDYMLSGDKPSNAEQKAEVSQAIYCPVNGLKEVRKFYEALTTQLVEIKSDKLRDGWYQLDACRDVGNLSHAVFVAQLFNIPLKTSTSINPLAVEVEDLHLAFSVLFAYVFLDADTARSFKLRLGAKQSAEQISKLLKLVCTEVHLGSYVHLNGILNGSKILRDYGSRLIERFFEGGKSIDEVVWAIVPTAAAAIATQAQHFAQMLDVYLTEPYSQHWPEIQRLSWSDSEADFEKLKSYALEANRLAPAAWGVLRRAATNTTINDGKKRVKVSENDQIYADFVAAGLDPNTFPEPHKIKLDRDRSLYIHHGFGAHSCVGRPIVEVAMAAQLKVFARLKNLRRAPGPQGQMKSTIPIPNPVSSDPKPNPGSIKVYMKEDWSDWWPFPTTLKVHHDGFMEGYEDLLDEDTGLPGKQLEIEMARYENEDANGLAPDGEGMDSHDTA